MKKTDNKTFADRAKALVNKYKRASFDSVERKELESELSKLAQEQEQYRAANGLDSNTQYSNGGPFGEDYIEPNIPIQNWMTDYNAFSQAPNVGAVQDSTFDPYRTSIIPSVASGLISTAGNLFLANKAGKSPATISASTITPQEISLAKSRESSKRRAKQAESSARRNIASSARTRGELLSNAAAAEVAASRVLGDEVSRSYEQEAIANAQERARAQQFNAQAAMNAMQYNASMQNQIDREKQAYLAAAMQSIPMTMRDIAQIQQQDAMINSLGEDYGIFMENYPGRKWYQPKRVTRKLK